jgi:hypothetical protein
MQVQLLQPAYPITSKPPGVFCPRCPYGAWMPALLSSTWMGHPLAFRSSQARLMALQDPQRTTYNKQPLVRGCLLTQALRPARA